MWKLGGSVLDTKVFLGLMNIIMRNGSQEQSGKDRMGNGVKTETKAEGSQQYPRIWWLHGVRNLLKTV